MQRLPADRRRRGDDPPLEAPILDRTALVAAARRVLARMPVAVAVSVTIEAPVAIVAAALLPVPWPWFALGAGYLLVSGPVLALIDGPVPAGRALRTAVDRGRDVLATAALESLGIAAITVPPAILWLALGIGPFGAYLTVLAFVAAGSRLALARPAVILRELSPTEALELSWDLVDGVAVEVGALFLAGATLSVGPAVAVAALAGQLGPATIGSGFVAAVALALFGPLLPLVLGEALGVLEARRRAVDPHFGRP